MTSMHSDDASPARVLLLGGTSEIGLSILSALTLPAGTEVILAGRDTQRLESAAKALAPAAAGVRFSIAPFDALDTASHQGFADEVCAAGVPDLVIAATGMLVPQPVLARDVPQAATMITTNFTSHVTSLLAFAGRMRERGRGTLVVLSSVAAVRPRKFNVVYGATKVALDAFARGLADDLHGSGVDVLLVRPGFVTGRMTEGMAPAPMATTPAAVGKAVASALDPATFQARRHGVVWVPAPLVGLAAVLRMIPRPIWRKLER
ncbi:MAG TPA: SDR family NAD(P)-dependent oxidoreductase [Trebonia sp.]|nr:SDR family NAD(P)-dependent oxidoreductase [Trebonia sp.]